MAFNGEHLFVGLIGYSPEFEAQGGIFVYTLVDGIWTLDQQLAHSGAGPQEAFGTIVEAGAEYMIGVAIRERTPHGNGGAYLFRRDDLGLWTEVCRLRARPIGSTSAFGSAVAVDNEAAIVCSLDEPGAPDGDGAAYFFDLSCRSCTPDLDLDGALTIFDFLLFFNLFRDDDPQADFDGDGQLTVLDFLAFQAAFDAGCP